MRTAPLKLVDFLDDGAGPAAAKEEAVAAATEAADALETARAQGYAAGLEEGRQSAEAAASAAIAKAAATAFTRLTTDRAALEVEIERRSLDYLAAVLRALLPRSAEDAVADEAAAMIIRVLKESDGTPAAPGRLIARAGPGGGAKLKAALAAVDTPTPIDVEEDARLGPWAVDIAWKAGGVDFDLHSIVDDVLARLEEYGPPLPAPEDAQPAGAREQADENPSNEEDQS